MKRVDGTKDRFNWIENYEIYYEEEEELLCHLEPPYPTKLNVKWSVYIREKDPANQHQILSCLVSHGIFTTCNYPVQPIIALTFIWKSIQIIFFLYNMLYFYS